MAKNLWDIIAIAEPPPARQDPPKSSGPELWWYIICRTELINDAEVYSHSHREFGRTLSEIATKMACEYMRHIDKERLYLSSTKEREINGVYLYKAYYAKDHSGAVVATLTYVGIPYRKVSHIQMAW